MPLEFSLYVFLLTFKMIVTIMATVFAFRIARLKMTQTYTWVLFGTAFFLRFLTQLMSLYFARDILGVYKNYELSLVIFTQAIEVAIVTLLLIAVLRSYYGVVNNTTLKFMR